MNNKIGSYYGLESVPIIVAHHGMSLKHGRMKTLWLGYCFLGFILGIITIQNKDNKDNVGNT
jgi:hypothetical protein